MAKSSEPQNTYESEVRDDWLDRFARFNQHFGRFARDALGVLLIAVALMTLLALRQYTQGILLTPWVNLLSLWFGWGAYLIVIAIGYIGYAFLRRSKTPLPWGRLFALEVATFLTLGLLAARTGNSLARAESGMDGGRVGWSLVTLFWRFGKTGGTFLMLIPWVLALMSGFNLWALIERSLMKLAGENQPVEAVSEPDVTEETSVVEEKKEKQPRKKPAQLPPEFRKSL
ncbi:MAG TPA: DNA translocase FtsK 4TM domain-containing protein, partial [Anaerolineales bacterium]|nr:DNA translocase FtsK 4TM domain-containing protein [Anaerolineales bacterium]